MRVAFAQVAVMRVTNITSSAATSAKQTSTPAMCRVEEIAVPARQGERPVEQRQQREAGARDRHDRQRRARVEQHRRERHLQQVQEDERIGGAAAEIKLRRQGGHIEQQGHQEPSLSPSWRASSESLCEIVHHERGQHETHRQER